MIAEPPIMCFDFGALKIWEGFSTISFKSIHRDLRTVGAQGAVLRIPNFACPCARMLGGGAYLLKRAPHLCGLD